MPPCCDLCGKQSQELTRFDTDWVCPRCITAARGKYIAKLRKQYRWDEIEQCLDAWYDHDAEQMEGAS